ncbi:MAG: helix-turn-helix domain-containing protein [Bacteroidales bacterium]
MIYIIKQQIAAKDVSIEMLVAETGLSAEAVTKFLNEEPVLIDYRTIEVLLAYLGLDVVEKQKNNSYKRQEEE